MKPATFTRVWAWTHQFQNQLRKGALTWYRVIRFQAARRLFSSTTRKAKYSGPLLR